MSLFPPYYLAACQEQVYGTQTVSSAGVKSCRAEGAERNRLKTPNFPFVVLIRNGKKDEVLLLKNICFGQLECTESSKES